MKKIEFIDKQDNSVTKAYISEDIEKVIPSKYYAETQLETKKDMLKTMYKDKPEFADCSEEFWYIEAAKLLGGMFTKIKDTEVPKNFLSLLESKKKKEQLSLLKGQTLTPEELFSLIIHAETKGYTFSEYHFRGTPPNVNSEQLPKMIEIKEDGNVRKVGETSLSDGQLKTAVEQSKTIVAKVLDKGDEWHCLYLTYKGLAGKEPGTQGQRPHINYISDKFGLSREELITKIKNGECPSSGVHIGILDYSSAENK